MNLKGKGQIGAFNDGGKMYFYPSNSIHWSFYDELKFTINHQYVGEGCVWHWDSDPSNIYGGFYDLVGNYSSSLNQLFNNIYRRGAGQSLILERYKTNLAAYGQRSTYQLKTIRL